MPGWDWVWALDLVWESEGYKEGSEMVQELV